MPPLNIEVTQFPGGLGSVGDNSILNAVPMPIPLKAGSVLHDFMSVDGVNELANYNAVAVGAGVTASNLNALNGVLRQTSGGAATDGNVYFGQDSLGAADGNQLTVGNAAWFGIRFRTDDPVENILNFGFGTQAGGIAVVDGVYLRCQDGTATLELVSVNSGAAESAIDLGDLAADTWYEAALYWDGIDKVSGQFVGPDGVVGGGGNILPGANLPAVEVAPMWGFSAGEAAAKQLDVDWVLYGGSR